MISEKICKFCNTLKTISEFPYRGNHYLKTCLSCYYEKENLKARIKYSDNLDYKTRKIVSNRLSQWRSRYNVEPEEVYKTLENQQNKCANKACGTEISLDIHETTTKRACLDHDHQTGNFRTLLCNRCNMILGHIEKNREVVEELIEYADKYRT